MSALTIRPSNLVHHKFKELAEPDQISVNHFIALDYLRSEAGQGDRDAFKRFLGKVPDAPAAGGAAVVVNQLAGKR